MRKRHILNQDGTTLINFMKAMGNNRVIFNTEVAELKISNKILILILEIYHQCSETVSKERKVSGDPSTAALHPSICHPLCLPQGDTRNGGKQPWGGKTQGWETAMGEGGGGKHCSASTHNSCLPWVLFQKTNVTYKTPTWFQMI